jgi:1-deoxy-D-xylulose-5-phosphate synthase
VLQDGKDIAIFGLGAMLPEADRLAKLLEREGQSVAVINPRFAKPLDGECVAPGAAAG